MGQPYTAASYVAINRSASRSSAALLVIFMSGETGEILDYG
jgi:hypothetical protein